MITHRDREMHGVRRLESEDRLLWWWGYFRWTRRTYRLWGIPIWFVDLANEERPITDLIRRATGS